MPLATPLICLGFAVWVAICAAAPEFIWQGLLKLIGHFSVETACSIVLIGLVLTVFVEPILERARDGRWTPERRNKRSLLFTAPIAFTFGVAAVGLHECMTAYLEAQAAAHDAPAEGVVKAANMILEWACIPLAVTLAWFGGRLKPLPRHMIGVGAAIWVAGASWVYGWPPPEYIITVIPCIVVIPLGQAYVARKWHVNTFRNLGIGLLGFGVLWLAMTLVAQAILRRFEAGEAWFYAPTDLGENFRFYLGWAIGLALAPDPVPAGTHEFRN